MFGKTVLAVAILSLGVSVGFASPFALVQSTWSDADCEPNGTGGGGACHGEINWVDNPGKYVVNCHDTSCDGEGDQCPDPGAPGEHTCKCNGQTAPTGCHAVLEKKPANPPANDTVKRCEGTCPTADPPIACKRTDLLTGTQVTSQCCICRTGTDDPIH